MGTLKNNKAEGTELLQIAPNHGGRVQKASASLFSLFFCFFFPLRFCRFEPGVQEQNLGRVEEAANVLLRPWQGEELQKSGRICLVDGGGRLRNQLQPLDDARHRLLRADRGGKAARRIK